MRVVNDAGVAYPPGCVTEIVVVPIFFGVKGVFTPSDPPVMVTEAATVPTLESVLLSDTANDQNFFQLVSKFKVHVSLRVGLSFFTLHRSECPSNCHETPQLAS